MVVVVVVIVVVVTVSGNACLRAKRERGLAGPHHHAVYVIVVLCDTTGKRVRPCASARAYSKTSCTDVGVPSFFTLLGLSPVV